MMLYVKRDDAGNIVAFNSQQTEECAELLINKESNIASSLQSDLSMVRVLEDLIETLVNKAIINITDLPQEVQQKLMDRKKLRETGLLKNDTHELIRI